MSQEIPQAAIVSEEELVPRNNRLKITKNNQRIASDSNIADSFVKLVVSILKHHKLYKPISLTATSTSASNSGGVAHFANLDYASLIWDEFEWQAISRMRKPMKQTKLPYPCFTKLIIDHLLSINKSLASRSDAFMHSEEQDSLFSKLINSTDGVLKFGKDLPDSMINDAIKQSTRNIVYKLRRSKVRKTLITSGNLEVNASSKPKNVVPRRKRTITYADNLVRSKDKLVLKKEVNTKVDEAYAAKKGKKLKCITSKDLVVQSLLDLRRGSKERRLESMRKEMQAGKGEGSKDVKDSDMDKVDEDSDKGDDTTAGFGVFMHDKTKKLPKYTPFSPTITYSSMKDYTMLLNDQPENELMDLMCGLVYTKAHTTFVVANPEGNPKVTSFLSGASEVPFGTNVDVQATKFVLQELFEDAANQSMSSPPATTTHNLITKP
ncbi:hypothetical protein Tco_1303961 [Tanacetum coccineum]